LICDSRGVSIENTPLFPRVRRGWDMEKGKRQNRENIKEKLSKR
jgi:hypothetical protein